jgi:sugar phosphate isomerase/epimerase
MRLGIIAKTFVRPDLERTLDAIKASGLDRVQFNFTCAGFPTLPDVIPSAVANRIRLAFADRSLAMAALSGTYNMVHPDVALRAQELSRLQLMIRACAGVGTSTVTLCTGTRDPDNMWRAHPDNQRPEAWQDLRTTLETLLPVAEEYGVSLGVEPEPANVIGNARDARRLLDEMGSPSLKIVADAANLVSPFPRAVRGRVIEEAFELLGPDIVLAHAKDLTAEAHGAVVAPGKGTVDFSRFFTLLNGAKFDGPVIMHSLTEAEVPDSAAFLQAELACALAGFN